MRPNFTRSFLFRILPKNWAEQTRRFVVVPTIQPCPRFDRSSGQPCPVLCIGQGHFIDASNGSPIDQTCKTVAAGWNHPFQKHPGRLTWNIVIEVGKIIFPSKWVRFLVNLPGWRFSSKWMNRQSAEENQTCFKYHLENHINIINIYQNVTSTYINMTSKQRAKSCKRYPSLSWVPKLPKKRCQRWHCGVRSCLLKEIHSWLVGGWTNPFEKYARQNGFIFPK